MRRMSGAGPARDAWGPAAPWVGVAAWAGAVGLLLALARTSLDALPGFVLAFAATGAVVVAAAAGRALRPPRPSVAVAAVGLGALASYAAATWVRPEALAALVAGLGLLLAGTWAGVTLGGRVGHARYIWPLVIVAAGADLWSVLAPEGITRQIVEGHAPVALNMLVLAVPVPGVGVKPLLGVGDVTFVGFLVGAVRALGLPMARLCLGFAVGFGLCLLGLLTLGLPLPALPFLGVAGAAGLGALVRPQWRELALALGVVAGVLAIGMIVRGTGVL